MVFLKIILGVFIVLLIYGIIHLVKDVKKERYQSSSINQINDLIKNGREKIICLDTETTGLDSTWDEILQLSVIDGNGKVLFDEYIKPSHRRTWRNAEAIHGISPGMVKNKQPITNHKAEITRIIEDSSLIIGYNFTGFDAEFLQSAGIIPQANYVVDVMLNFSQVYGEWNSKYKSYKYKKLEVCTKYYKYSQIKKHNSLQDAKATLFCFYEMAKRKQIKIIDTF